MIRVSLSSLAVVLAALMLGPVIIMWVYGEWRRAKKYREAMQGVTQCVMCGFQFRRENPKQTAALCPRCDAPVGASPNTLRF
jgi:uncharacterized paraquat-inducible protein A